MKDLENKLGGLQAEIDRLNAALRKKGEEVEELKNKLGLKENDLNNANARIVQLDGLRFMVEDLKKNNAELLKKIEQLQKLEVAKLEVEAKFSQMQVEIQNRD